MGRWAQKRRTGSRGASSAIIEINEAVLFDAETALLRYTGAIDAGAFDPADFESNPSGLVGVIVTQQTENSIFVEFEDVVDLDTSVEYTGSLSNIRSPQTVLYT